MKKSYIFLILGALSMALPQTVSAQNKVRVHYRNSDKESGTEIVKFIQTNEEKHFIEPEAPRFVLTDRDGKVAFGIGGQVRAVVAEEFGGIINTSTDQGFQPAFIPMSGSGATKAQFRLSPGTSEIFLKLVGRTKRAGNFSVYLSTNFQGENYAPQLRKAYVKFYGFTVGQTWSTFTDLSAIPPTIDYASPNGTAIVMKPMVRYSRNVAKDHLTLALAAEFPTVAATYGTLMPASSVPQSVPDIVGYIQANWSQGKGHLRLSGLLRNMAYRNGINQDIEIHQGWGAQVSGLTPIAGGLQMFYQFAGGKGISTYLNDLSNFNLDLVPDYAKDGYLQSLPMWGVTGGLQYTFNSKVFASASYSQSRVYSQHYYSAPDMYRYGQYMAANVFWTPIRNLQVAAEYLYGIKHQFNSQSGHANRINLMIQYSF